MGEICGQLLGASACMQRWNTKMGFLFMGRKENPKKRKWQKRLKNLFIFVMLDVAIVKFLCYTDTVIFYVKMGMVYSLPYPIRII